MTGGFVVICIINLVIGFVSGMYFHRQLIKPNTKDLPES
jgi:uncharacterized protein YneF (UPF0154 family)